MESHVAVESRSPVRLGFVPLNDCAPVAVAQELGLFKSYGLNVKLSRQPGWATVRDMLSYGELDAAQSIAGLAFYTGRPIELLRRRNPPVPSLPLRPTERFLLSETAFRELWASKSPVYLVTDSFLDGAGVLDPLTAFTLVGQVGNRWVVRNQP